MKRTLLTLSLLALGYAGFAQFTANRIVVSQYGDGSVVASGKTAPVFLKEFKTTLENAPAENTATLTFPMPVSGDGEGVNYPLTGTMDPTYEGLISLSANGQYITMLGFGLAPGIAPVQADMRVLATVAADGTVNSMTNVKGSANNLNNPRSAVTVDGTGYWSVGSGGGVRYKAAGYGGASAATSAVSDNSIVGRSTTIFNGKLYLTTTANDKQRIYWVAKTTDPVNYLPINNTGVATTVLNGLSATTPNQLLFFRMDGASTGDPDLLYFTNDGGGKIEKWVWNAGATPAPIWEKKGEVAISGVKGITGQIIPSVNKAYIYVTSDSKLLTFEDGDVQNSDLTASVVTTLATAPTNTKFRGVSLTPNSQTVLPVKLTSFNGRQQLQTVKLNWATASEQNNSHFNVLRANDSKKFSTIGKVDGNGTTNTAQQYTFTDNNPYGGNNYYQLEQVDFDGKTQKSEVVAVKTDIKDKTLRIKADGDQLEATIYADGADAASLSIANVSGQKVYNGKLQLTNGYNQYSVNIAQLQAGVYIATVVVNGKAYSQKFIR